MNFVDSDGRDNHGGDGVPREVRDQLPGPHARHQERRIHFLPAWHELGPFLDQRDCSCASKAFLQIKVLAHVKQVKLDARHQGEAEAGARIQDCPGQYQRRVEGKH